jgi:Anti-sigma-28 factor, FlgM
MAVDPELRRRIAEGEYVVDPRAVADAMLRRSADRADARRLSRMLVSGEVDRLPGGPHEPQPGARRD